MKPNVTLPLLVLGLAGLTSTSTALGQAVSNAKPAPAAVTPGPEGGSPAAIDPGPASGSFHPDSSSTEKTTPWAITAEGEIGLSTRLGPSSSGYDIAGRSGLLWGVAGSLIPTREFSVALSYSSRMAGLEAFDSPVVKERISRHLHTALLQVRAVPVRGAHWMLLTGIAAGQTWQTASATGTYVASAVVPEPTPFRLTGGPDAGLALGMMLGLDADLSDHAGAVFNANFVNHRLTSDWLARSDRAVLPGIGGLSTFDFRMGLRYRFDL